MSNMQKYKANQCSYVLGENLRTDCRDRERVDDELTKDNYNLSSCENPYEAIQAAVSAHENISGRKIRCDANVMFSWVTTLPKDCPVEHADEFFELVHKFMCERYGEKNIIADCVHKDEPNSRYHIHTDAIPVDENGKINAKVVLDRNELRSFHRELNKHVDENLGFHVSVLLDESKEAEKKLSKLPHKEFISLQKEIDKQKQSLEDWSKKAQTLHESVANLENEKKNYLMNVLAENKPSTTNLIEKRESKLQNLMNESKKLEATLQIRESVSRSMTAISNELADALNN